MDVPSAAARGADVLHWAFDEHHHRLRAITRRVQQRFERRDWAGIRQDTVERLHLHSQSVERTWETLREQLGPRAADPALWAAMKEAYARAILGRDDFELAQTFFNSVARKAFPEIGADPARHFVGADVPRPIRGWEMASARMYAVRRVDPPLVRKVLEDSGLRAPFRDLEGDAALAAERMERGIAAAFGTPEIDALDVLRPVFFRNKGAYLIGRARRKEEVVPLLLALVHREEGLVVDAVLSTQDEASIVFSFARWYFHADVASPREATGFLSSILPRKRVAELYISLGYTKHGKTEFYRDLTRHIAASPDRFVRAPGQRGMVMSVFTLPSYEFVFKVIRDSFPPPKDTTREKVMARYREVLERDRVGRLVDFQEFEHLTFPRARFDSGLLAELLSACGETVAVEGDEVVVRHVYVERRVTPLDVYLAQVSGEQAEAAALDWGKALEEMAAADIFPGDILLKNFGVTRHGRVVSYDYDELARLTACRFLPLPEPRDEIEELAAEPWFAVGEGDVFPEELRTFLGLQGRLRESFLAAHPHLFEPVFWQGVQERIRRGEMIDFYPYGEEQRLHPGEGGREEATPPPHTAGEAAGGG